MTCWGAADLALSPCSSLDRWQGILSLPTAYRKRDRGDRGEGDDPQNTPNPPKWNWQAHWSNCSQHYFLWQEILLSTNRRFNKRQEMRLRAVVKRLCLSYAVEVTASPDDLPLWPALSHILFVPFSYFFSSLYIPCFFRFLHLTTTSLTTHRSFVSTPSFLALFSWVIFFLGNFFLDHFSWMWQRKFLLLRIQQVDAPLSRLLRLFLCCHYGGVMLILSQWILLIWARVMIK